MVRYAYKASISQILTVRVEKAIQILIYRGMKCHTPPPLLACYHIHTKVQELRRVGIFYTHHKNYCENFTRS